MRLKLIVALGLASATALEDPSIKLNKGGIKTAISWDGATLTVPQHCRSDTCNALGNVDAALQKEITALHTMVASQSAALAAQSAAMDAKDAQLTKKDALLESALVAQGKLIAALTGDIGLLKGVDKNTIAAIATLQKESRDADAKLRDDQADAETKLSEIKDQHAKGLSAVALAYKAADATLRKLVDDVTKMEGPQGERGERGERGEQGIQGVQGVQGVQGERGPRGFHGPKGAEGEQGATGKQGAKGEQGAKGDKGAKGDTGDKGDTGSKGDTGDKGDKGDTGAAGSAPAIKCAQQLETFDTGRTSWTWPAADTFCKSKGMELPTYKQLCSGENAPKAGAPTFASHSAWIPVSDGSTGMVEGAMEMVYMGKDRPNVSGDDRTLQKCTMHSKWPAHKGCCRHVGSVGGLPAWSGSAYARPDLMANTVTCVATRCAPPESVPISCAGLPAGKHTVQPVGSAVPYSVVCDADGWMQVLVAEHKSSLTRSCCGTSYNCAGYAATQRTCGLNYDSPVYSRGYGEAGEATYFSPAWTGAGGAIAPAFSHAQIRYDDALTPGRNCGRVSCGPHFLDDSIKLKPGTAFMANSKAEGQIRFNSDRSDNGGRAGGRLYHDEIHARCNTGNGSSNIARGGIGTLRKCSNTNHGGPAQLFYGWYPEYGHDRDSATISLWVR